MGQVRHVRQVGLLFGKGADGLRQNQFDIISDKTDRQAKPDAGRYTAGMTMHTATTDLLDKGACPLAHQHLYLVPSAPPPLLVPSAPFYYLVPSAPAAGRLNTAPAVIATTDCTGQRAVGEPVKCEMYTAANPHAPSHDVDIPVGKTITKNTGASPHVPIRNPTLWDKGACPLVPGNVAENPVNSGACPNVRPIACTHTPIPRRNQKTKSQNTQTQHKGTDRNNRKLNRNSAGADGTIQ